MDVRSIHWLRLWYQRFMRPTMSSMDSWRLVRVSREQVDHGVLLKFVVAIQHQGSAEVLKKVHIVPRAGAVVFVQLGCLFAHDLITDQSFLACDMSPNSVIPALVPHWSPQQSGLVCPCCGHMVP